MKILILGSKGMLGSEFVRQIQTRGRENVTAWDREELDITDKKQVKEKISALAPDIVINCAAYNNVDKAENEDRELAMKVNGEAVGYLAEAATDVDAIFVHYSSDYVFKGDKVGGYKEDDGPEPQSWYAKTKYNGEKQISNFKFQISNKIQNPNIKYYLIRTSRLFGPAGVGEGAKKSFVDTMIDLIKNQRKRELDLVDEELSSPTYVNDLAQATVELTESKAPYGIYQRTNSGACTWYGWAKKIFELAGISVKLNPVSASKFLRPAVRPKYSVLLNTKLPAMRSWEEALGEYIKNFKL